MSELFPYQAGVFSPQNEGEMLFDLDWASA